MQPSRPSWNPGVTGGGVLTIFHPGWGASGDADGSPDASSKTRSFIRHLKKLAVAFGRARSLAWSEFGNLPNLWDSLICKM